MLIFHSCSVLVVSKQRTVELHYFEFFRSIGKRRFGVLPRAGKVLAQTHPFQRHLLDSQNIELSWFSREQILAMFFSFFITRLFLRPGFKLRTRRTSFRAPGSPGSAGSKGWSCCSILVNASGFLPQLAPIKKYYIIIADLSLRIASIAWEKALF